MPRSSKTKLSAKPQLDESLPPFPQKRVTKRDLARMYGISLRTVDTWISKKRVPYLKIGKIVRFNVDQVEKAIDRSTIREVS